jgi:hypothetical protein
MQGKAHNDSLDPLLLDQTPDTRHIRIEIAPRQGRSPLDRQTEAITDSNADPSIPEVESKCSQGHARIHTAIIP